MLKSYSVHYVNKNVPTIASILMRGIAKKKKNVHNCREIKPKKVDKIKASRLHLILIKVE